MEPWRAFWHRWVSSAYARAYAETIQQGDLLPESRREMTVLLKAHLLEKAVHEVAYELRNRPTWTRIPLQAILDLVAGWDEGPAQEPVVKSHHEAGVRR